MKQQWFINENNQLDFLTNEKNEEKWLAPQYDGLKDTMIFFFLEIQNNKTMKSLMRISNTT